MHDTIAPGVTQEVASGAPLLGFSTRLVVEATADYVADVIGHDGDTAPWWRKPGVTSPGIHRVRETDAYRLHITGGTLTMDVVQARPYVDDSGPAFDLRALRRKVAIEKHGGGVWWSYAPEPLEELDAHPAGVITTWSPRSRARMLRALAEIDHDSWVSSDPIAMVTLTLPGDWLAVAPTGADFKRAFRRFVERWRWAIGWWQCAWKLEFQDRGAPHLHLATRPPAVVNSLGYPVGFGYGRDLPFREWLSGAWASAVRASDACDCGGRKGRNVPMALLCTCETVTSERKRHLIAGTNVRANSRNTDPKRLAIYFYKHSAKTQDSKEYQHIVPEEWRSPGKGPGRFWGIAGLERPRSTVELHPELWHQLRRELRKLDRSQNARTALSRRAAVTEDVGEAVRRATLCDLRLFGARKTRRGTSPMGGLWLILNDAPAAAAVLARWLASRGPVGVSP